MAKRLVVLIALVSASVVALPAPADAAITWRMRTSTFTIDAGYLKTVKLACPTGTRVAGGGVSLSPHHTQVQPRANQPYDGSDSDTSADDGWSATYRNYLDRARTITLSVVCASGISLVYSKKALAVPADGVPRHGYVDCPSGYHVLAGGAGIGSGQAGTTWGITAFWPGRSVTTQNYDTFHGAAVGRGGRETRALTLHAVCSTREPAVTYRDGSVGATSATSVLSSCVTAQLATGGGVHVDGPNGLQYVMNATPRHTQGDSLPDAWSTLVVNNHGQSHALRFFRICPART